MELRDLPSVNELADQIDATGLGLPRALLVDRARRAIDRARSEIAAGIDSDPHAIALLDLESLAGHRPRPVVNATGVLLHTNLGRAPIAERAALVATGQATRYGNLEFDLTRGSRGGRGAYLRDLLVALTGAESALVVNNNAAALVLSIAALAGDERVVVSRGELIEIGGSFRLPELMTATGAQLVEIGTTNRTRVNDYERAAGMAAMILKVHPSNYRIEGFSEAAGWHEVAVVAKRAGVPFVADVGSGLLDTRTPWLTGDPPPWLAEEPGVRQTLESGADVVLFSGDKLLGGPQAGIAVGTSATIEAMRRHPLARAFRIDGPSAAALAATLEAYADGTAADLPFWRMAALTREGLSVRLEALADMARVEATLVEGRSVPGAGSAPGVGIPTPQLLVRVPPEAAWRRLLGADPPIIVRRTDDGVLIDLRAVDPRDDAHIGERLGRLLL